MSHNITSIHVAESDIKSCGKFKCFPDGSWEILVASKPIFGGGGWELSDKSDTKSSKPQSGKHDAADIDRARRRAAAKVRDIARCTTFRWFVTLTFNAAVVDRYSPSDCLRKMRSWLDNRVRRNGLAYILVPELHKDGALHFHGFFNDADIGIVDSGTLRVIGSKHPRRPRSERQRAEWLSNGAQPVFNISDWSFGFSTAIEIYGDYNAAIGYCCKYIGKQGDKIGGRWYYSGGNLHTPDVSFIDCDYYTVAADPRAYCFKIDGTGAAFALLRGGADDSLCGGDST